MTSEETTLAAAKHFGVPVANLTPAMRHRFKILRDNGLVGVLYGGSDLGDWTQAYPNAVVPDPLD